MLWPFSLLTSSRSPVQGTIEAIYGAIVARAREPAFYRTYGVPDTVDGRFDLLVLHLWLVMRAVPAQSKAISQNLVDRFCSDMDHNLRELGVGDLTVPKRMIKFGEALYGRARAYDDALADDAATRVLEDALNRNIYNGKGGEGPARLAVYVRDGAASLGEALSSDLERGILRFPPLLD